jgi:hypothetical protein
MSRPAQPNLSRFSTTQWSLVGRAAVAGTKSRGQAMGDLLRRYLPALRAHLVLTKGVAPQEAEDLLQGFVSDKIIEHNLLTQAKREKGKLRSLLVTALDRYVVSEIRRQHAHKRAPRGGLLSLEERYCQASTQSEPSRHFDLAWGREVLAEVLQRMQDECLSHRRSKVWAIFEARIAKPALDGVPPLPYEQLVRDLALKTPLQACNLLVTAKRLFVRELRAVVEEYVHSPQEVDEEILHLKAIFSQAGA